MPHSILVVEDDEDLCTLLDYNLGRAGYSVEIVHGVKSALERLEKASPDLIILDVMLPDGDGFEFCRQVRSDPNVAPLPILFLTARGEEVDRVLGLEIGGDDYVTKPFSPRELVARVKAHLRRRPTEQPQPSAKPTAETNGPLEVDVVSRRVFVRGRQISLTATEFRILEFFLANPDRVFSREKLLESVWGHDHHVTPRNVDVHVLRLRERIEETPDDPKWLQTVRGFGYRFELPA